MTWLRNVAATPADLDEVDEYFEDLVAAWNQVQPLIDGAMPVAQVETLISAGMPDDLRRPTLAELKRVARPRRMKVRTKVVTLPSGAKITRKTRYFVWTAPTAPY